MKTLHCAVLIDELNSPHGTEMLAVLLAQELRRRGWRVTIHTAHFRRHKSPWAPLLSELGIPVHHPGFWRLNRYELPRRVAAWKFWRWCARAKPDVIWSPTNDMLTCLALQACSQNTPPFFVHDPSEASPACPFYPPLWLQVCNRVTALSVHGERQKAGALALYGMQKPVEVVHPSSLPPELVEPLGPVERVVRFGQLGRMFSMKGTLFAVAAFAQAIARGANAELHFFGDGPMRPATEELARSLGVAERVHFHGRYLWTDVDRLVSQIDVGLMPSIYEGFGLVMLELMARGRPVIASDVGSSREVIESHDIGCVVKRADTASLADAMVAFCQDAAQIRRQGERAASLWREHFTPEAMTDRYLAFWKQHGIPETNGRMNVASVRMHHG